MTKKGRAAHGEVKPSKFKTSMCQFFLSGSECPYAPRCAFAHGPDELRTEEENISSLIGISTTTGRSLNTTPQTADKEQQAAYISKQQQQVSDPPSPANASLGLSYASTPHRRPTISPPLPLFGDEDIASLLESRTTVNFSSSATAGFSTATNLQQHHEQAPTGISQLHPRQLQVPCAMVSSVWSFHSLEYSAGEDSATT